MFFYKTSTAMSKVVHSSLVIGTISCICYVKKPYIISKYYVSSSPLQSYSLIGNPDLDPRSFCRPPLPSIPYLPIRICLRWSDKSFHEKAEDIFPFLEKYAIFKTLEIHGLLENNISMTELEDYRMIERYRENEYNFWKKIMTDNEQLPAYPRWNDLVYFATLHWAIRMVTHKCVYDDNIEPYIYKWVYGTSTISDEKKKEIDEFRAILRAEFPRIRKVVLEHLKKAKTAKMKKNQHKSENIYKDK